MRHSLAIPVLAAACAFGATAHGQSMEEIWAKYVETCEPISLQPAKAMNELDLSQYDPDQYFSVDDGKMVGLTLGTPEYATWIAFGSIDGMIGSTCSASVRAGPITVEDVDNFFRALPDTEVVGGKFPLILPQGGGFASHPSHNILVAINSWSERGARLHVQHDMAGGITLTTFGEETAE
ncbi:hypothetical protein [Litorisediminicola beolgyonensis]|uniref:Lipoprotein n=1 Tax=Litorisediminicola beolgyonensis TaxID=1173614 RepID=A0ABW3ZD25_9RHOB